MRQYYRQQYWFYVYSISIIHQRLNKIVLECIWQLISFFYILQFSLIKLIATFQNSSLVSNHQYHPHLDTSGSQTHPLILLLNALLTQKRIIFLGQGRPSGEVANYVLAACAMGSGGGGVLRGFSERAFPYTNLTQVDELLKV